MRLVIVLCTSRPKERVGEPRGVHRLFQNFPEIRLEPDLRCVAG